MSKVKVGPANGLGTTDLVTMAEELARLVSEEGLHEVNVVRNGHRLRLRRRQGVSAPAPPSERDAQIRRGQTEDVIAVLVGPPLAVVKGDVIHATDAAMRVCLGHLPDEGADLCAPLVRVLVQLRELACSHASATRITNEPNPFVILGAERLALRDVLADVLP